MSRFLLAASATFALLALAAPAHAADLPSRYAPQEPYYAPAPIFTWTGFYAGVHGELGIGSFSNGGNAAFGSPIGGLGGATLGYNFQSGQLVVGGEADIAFGSVSSSSTFGSGVSGSGAIHGIGTIRGRLGYVYDRALFFVTGGYAGTSLDGKLSDFAGSPNLVLDESHYLNGFAVGLGMEYAITTKISLKGEYLFTGFGSQSYFTGTRDTINSGANISLLRAGLNYHF